LKEQKKDVAMQFVERIRQMEEVTECFNTSGDYDYLLKIYLRNMEHYRDFVVNKLATIDSIGNFSSNFVIEEVKYTTHIPIYPKE
jgi:Lrp/AsnC family leucine-responsive transcriptional regulator